MNKLVKTAKVASALKNVKAVRPAISRMIAFATGKRGTNARLVEVHTTPDKVLVRALRNKVVSKTGTVTFENLKTGVFAEFKDNTLTGDREALIQLGTYVNGGLRKANVSLIPAAEFDRRAASGNIQWRVTKDPVPGSYIGNPHNMDCVAVKVVGDYWQVEQVANPNNKSERGLITPLKKGQKLAITK